MLKFKTLLAFAKDSVSCMAYFYKDSWCAPPDDVKSPFSHIMGEAIIRFTLYYRDWLDRVAEEVVYCVDEDPDEFFEFGYQLADELFQNEPYMELIAVCSFITYTAHIFFILGKKHFMDKAYFMIAILFLKLRDRFEANGSWKNFQILCLQFVKMVMQEGKNEQRHLTGKGKNSSKVYSKSTSANHSSTMISKHSIVTRSKSADSIQKSNGATLNYTGTRLKSTGVNLKSAGVNLKSSDVNLKSAGAIPKSAGAIPKCTGAIPKSTGAIPKSTGAIPKSTDAFRKSMGVIPKSTDVIPRSQGAIPKSMEKAEISSDISNSTTSSVKRFHAHRNRTVDPYEIYNGPVLVTACFYYEEPRKVRQKSTESNPSRNRKSI